MFLLTHLDTEITEIDLNTSTSRPLRLTTPSRHLGKTTGNLSQPKFKTSHSQPLRCTSASSWQTNTSKKNVPPRNLGIEQTSPQRSTFSRLPHPLVVSSRLTQRARSRPSSRNRAEHQSLATQASQASTAPHQGFEPTGLGRSGPSSQRTSREAGNRALRSGQKQPESNRGQKLLDRKTTKQRRLN